MQGQAQRVAVIGAGAVGCYYGGRLAEAGHDVSFLMRRDYDAVRRNGLTIHSVDGDFRLENPCIARSSDEIGPVDWVLCALKAPALEGAPSLFAPCLTPETRVLAIMNGLGVEERLAGWLGGERVYGGMAFTCINRGEPGVVHHLRYGALTLAHYGDDAERLSEARSLWEGSRVEVSTTPLLLRARWTKLCWNIPFNGLTVAAGGVGTEHIVGDPELRAEALAVMREVIAIANADLAAHKQPALEGDELIETMFQLTDTMGDYRPSTLIDFMEGRPLEVDAIFAEPLRRAHAHEVPAHRLEVLTAKLLQVSERAA
jgi:2-dehydropantoate 2-reductase